MLRKVIIDDGLLSPSSQRIKNIFQQGLLLTRMIRSLNDVIAADNLTEVYNDIKEELSSYDTGENTKHAGMHFSTTLIYPKIPMRLFNTGLGLIFDFNGLQYRNLCLIDARDDDGHLDKDKIPVVNDFQKFIRNIKKLKPDHTGYCPYNEVQAYLKRDNLMGIFVSINKISDSDEEQQIANIAAYLEALAIQKFLLRRFNLNLQICLYDQKNGDLYIATRNPDIITLKLYLNVINQNNYSPLGLHSVDRDELISINKMIMARLGMTMPDSEFDSLIDKSLKCSQSNDRKETIAFINENLSVVSFPNNEVFLRYSGSNQAYQLIIMRDCSDITKERMNAMLSSLKFRINKENEGYYHIIFKSESELEKLMGYFLRIEDITLRDRASEIHNESAALRM